MMLHGGSIETKFEDMHNTNSSDTELDQPLNTLPKKGNSSEQQGHVTKTNVEAAEITTPRPTTTTSTTTTNRMIKSGDPQTTPSPTRI
jgi:hypothetical protein